MIKYRVILVLLLVSSQFTRGIELDPTSYDSIQSATSLLVDGLMDYYEGFQYGGTIGMFQPPYYWWEAGGAWGSMIDHWYFLQNKTYEKVIYDSLLFQKGDNWDFIPLNQSSTEGNDDQAFWGIAAIQAAERNFTNPTTTNDEDEPGWLYLAQAVFNTMASRWDMGYCNGGLRWQIFQWNSGYNYKNTVSNAGLFHIGARLARYTSNDSYVDWSEKVYDWLLGVGFIEENEGYYVVYDGASVDTNCSTVSKFQWTYNIGLVISGCAYLYNYTEDDIWLNRTLGFLHGARVFFNESIMYEAACQSAGSCNNDQRSFKAYFSRFLGLVSVLVPETSAYVDLLILKSAMGASRSCSGGYDGHTCGLNWFHEGGWDGMYGLGEQMSALEVIQNLLIHERPPPFTADNGGSSQGDASNAGSRTQKQLSSPLDLNTGDKVGAALITSIFGFSVIGGLIWILI